eukprot:TRINITY_DN3433_c0_g2_i9.p1 TRINITY_DN3433_c0_g2~~TRINITY_DN3433_c0_g2_i9.p1  ORF type:complete len:263 (+),score=58.32 TRINITY_DN3433_c0_g2_i9:267-1055(+)
MTSPLNSSGARISEIQSGPRKFSVNSLATSEALKLKSNRPSSNLLQSLSLKLDACISVPHEPILHPEYAYSKKICLLMNDLYYNSLSYKNKAVLMLEELGKITNADVANSVLLSVFQNLKYYVKEIRNTLRSKLYKLGLLESRRSPQQIKARRYSADCFIESSQDTQLSWWNKIPHTSELKPFHGSEEKYIEFLTYLRDIYRNYSVIISRGPERICHKLLSLCKSAAEVEECDVHKTAFYDFVLEDRVVSVTRRVTAVESPQ